MKFIVFLIAFALTTKVNVNKCGCSEAITKEYCREEGANNCEWNDGKCVVTPQPECKDYSGKYQCIADARCAWEQGSSKDYSCVNFSNCSRSKANSQTACREYSSGCTYYGGEACEAFVNPPCKEKDQASCNADQSCFYSTVDSRCIELVSCSEANTLKDDPAIQQACKSKPYACIYQQNKCQDRTSCGQYSATECQFFSDIKITQATLCKVTDGACKEYDAKSLTETSCWYDSLQSYYWNGKSCTQCKGASYGLIIGIIVMVIL